MQRIYLSPPHMGGEELKYINDVFESNYIAPVGKHITYFENEVAKRFGANGVLALSSGTAAIHLALRFLKVKADDIVLCSSLTFVGSANPILYERAIPVFIDSEPETWNMSPVALEQAFQKYCQMDKQPKAVIAVNLYGQCADMNAISCICKKYDTPMIEDAAESIGAKYQNQFSGTFGEFGIFSFNGNKMITTSGGGMLLSHDQDAINKARYWSTQARDPVVHYEHSELGYNYRMSNVLAAIGLGQLKVLDAHIQRCRQIFNRYEKELGHIPGIDFMPEPPGYFSNRWLTVMTMAPSLESPLTLINHLEEHNIESRPVWKPMHLQPLFQGTDFFPHDHHQPVSEQLFETGICLPSGPGMTDEEQSRVIVCILEKI
ncbi:MAG: DegT/DnrJ/EryC1/StrS aminotransferase [Candidatus Magnetoglobus multicellularis str. Araruama]|uniref:GDP-perosamine synthase n=1 Tax=Candidatus Magnetoglobus multicellularis str. Araruama TaxID=890399 RepID=A0A1V1PIF6_9BACT|nr:MAG: DegT/DnrJ/EryC1/StrS aminotransferase [Candidatus Magnetoglobus multicellularis str. Araruama]